MKFRHVQFFLIFMPVMVLFSCSPEKDNSSAIAGKIHEYIAAMEKQSYAGAILVAQNGSVLYKQGIGMAIRSTNTPNTPRTVFTIGSITKQFTAAAILKLQMMNKLHVTDHISTYIPNVPDDKQDITIHHLLTHSAGFASAIGGDFSPISRDDFVANVMKAPLVSPPGQRYLYSNIGYSLLGIIIENISGQRYEQFLNQYLFTPAGMTSTGYSIPNWDSDIVAHGYTQNRDWGTLLDKPWDGNAPYWHLRANGGILSTVEDMYKWHLALLGTKILSDEVKQMMFTPHISEGPEGRSYYGYGWAIFTTPRNTRLVAHNGGNRIFSADMMRFLDDDVVIIVFSNVAEQPAWKISKTLSNIVFHEPYDVPSGKREVLTFQQLTKSPTGKRALSLLHIYSITDTDTTRQFIQDNLAPAVIRKYTLPELLGFLQQDQQGLGTCNLRRAVQTGTATLELTVQSQKSGDWWLITLRFEPDPPHRIVRIDVDDTAPIQ